MANEVFTLTIETPKGKIEGFLHWAADAKGGIIMVGGAGGGTHGPAGIYEPLANRLQHEGIAALRLEYRQPNNLPECVYDTLAGIEALSEDGVEKFILLGWSFGGAVVISAGAISEKVVGVATVASQTYGADAVGELAPKSLLLLHGTGDQTLPDRCSRQLYREAGEPKELVLYPNDNHGITGHAEQMLEKIFGWSMARLNGDKARRVSNGER